MLSPFMPSFEPTSMPAAPQQPVFVNQSQSSETTPPQLDDHEITRTVPVLQWFIDQYKSYLGGYTCLAIELAIADQAEAMRRHHYFQYSNGTIQSVSIVPARADFTVRFESYVNYERFLVSKDMQYVQYSFNQ